MIEHLVLSDKVRALQREVLILNQRWTTLTATLQDAIDSGKELTGRDVAHKITMGQKALMDSIPVGEAAVKQWVDLHGEPTTSEAEKSMKDFVDTVASQSAQTILSTPTPPLKETPDA